MTAMVPEAPSMKKIQIPRKEIDDFFRLNSEMLNTQARELFTNMGAEDQRRVLNSGPLNIFREPMEMFKFRVSINKEREKEIADRKGGEFVAKEAAEYEVNDWVKANKSYLGEEGAKHLDMFGPADQWRIISEGPASENMDPVHVIQTRAKRSRELANTVSVMFAQRREQANSYANSSAEAKAAAKPLFKPELADTVQAFFNRVVGCEVPDTQRRTGGFGVQHILEEDKSTLIGKVKGIEGVVEILKNKYDCLKGERYRVVGERGGPAGMWRLEGGKTIPKTHVKEGGWRWVLEEPEPEAKLAKPPPVATAPVQTFTPKEQKQPAQKSESEEESAKESSSERSDRPKRKVLVRKRRVKKKAGSEDSDVDTRKPKKGKTAVTRKRCQPSDDGKAPKKVRAKGRVEDSDNDSRESPRGGQKKGGASNRRGRPAQDDSRDDDSRISEDSRRGRPIPRSKSRR